VTASPTPTAAAASDGWTQVLGQPVAITALRRAVAADEVSHAWLMVGPRGVGQREAARALAMALNCPRSTADAGCGTCETCERIARGAHPAVDDLEPEGTHHVVDAVRGEWTRAATRTMTEGRRRVLRVVAADRMNEAAQNAFLKILEEPPPSVVWMLDAQDEGLLLDTVRSRCRRIELVPWGPDAMGALAERLGIDEHRRAALTRAALGSPERMRDLADPDVADARDTHLAIVERLAEAGPGDAVPIAKELVAWSKARAAVRKEANQAELERLEEAFGAEGGRGWPPGVRNRLTRRFERLERQERRRALDQVLDDLGSWLRDLLVVQGGGSDDALVNIDQVPRARRDAPRLTPLDTVACLAAVAACRDALDRNGSPELQVERLLLSIALPLYTRSAAITTTAAR
jgi:DNA polymerase III subunit delta'